MVFINEYRTTKSLTFIHSLNNPINKTKAKIKTSRKQTQNILVHFVANVGIVAYLGDAPLP